MGNLLSRCKKQEPHRPISLDQHWLQYKNLKKKTRKMIQEQKIVGAYEPSSPNEAYYKLVY